MQYFKSHIFVLHLLETWLISLITLVDIVRKYAISNALKYGRYCTKNTFYRAEREAKWYSNYIERFFKFCMMWVCNCNNHYYRLNGKNVYSKFTNYIGFLPILYNNF